MTFTLKPFSDLSTDELYAHLCLRQRVFVVEQTCPYLDCDGLDTKAFHLWASDRHLGTIAYARIFGPGTKYEEACIGRVATAPEHRRTGLGRALVGEALGRVESLFGAVPIRIQAQSYLERFYGDFGFVRVSDEYLEDEILHVDMLRAGRPRSTS